MPTLADVAERHAPHLRVVPKVDRNLRGYDRTRSNANGDDTRAKIVGRCRALMITGRFRPMYHELVKGGVSRKAIVYHFRTLDDLYEEALDEPTRVGILTHLMPNGPWPASDDCARIVRAVTLGRLVTS